MQVPYLTETGQSRTIVDVFGGYDHRPVISESSFYDTENLAGDAYPALAPRKPRGLRALPMSAGAVNALLGGTKLVYAAAGGLYVNDERVMALSDSKPKRLIAMGAYVIVLPDKVYYNTVDKSDHGKIENTRTTSGTVKFSLANYEGNEYTVSSVGKSAPKTPSNLDYWLDTSDAKKPVLKQFSATTGMWVSVASTTIRITAQGVGSGFAANDAVRIRGIPAKAAPLDEYNGKDLIIQAAGEDWIAVVGVMDVSYAESTQSVTVGRTMPVMDHVFECGNRLWGCRYGEDADGKFVNEIYCSSLGDFKNWRRYAGVSTDSYAASVGAEGAWTGGIAYQSMPHFFKDDKLFRVYGAYPAAYQITELSCRGVQAGAAESLQVLNERLFYKTRNGVCIYDGAYPTEISDAFGEIKYVGTPAKGMPAAAAGACDNRYYISMLSEADGQYHLFCYDLRLGVWYREDCTQAVSFAVEAGRLVYADAEGLIRTVSGGDVPVRWSAETGVIGMCVPGSKQSKKAYAASQKYVTRVTLRMTMALGSRVTVEIQYDSTPEWIHAATVESYNIRSFSLPIQPRRCDHFRLRISGEGDVKIFSIMKTLEEGSELP